MTRIIVIIGLLALGVFCWRKGMTSRPHKLKKEPLRIWFARKSPGAEPGEIVDIIPSAKLAEGIATAVWLAVAVGAFLAWRRGAGSPLFVLLALFGAVYNFQLTTRRIEIYAEAIVFCSLFRRMVFPLADVDCLEAYNTVNAFGRGVNFGYQLRRGGETLCRFPNGSYRDLQRLEDIFSEGHPAVERVDTKH